MLALVNSINTPDRHETKTLQLFVNSAEQELGLDLTSPLLKPTDNKMMNRISSSIIRELTSNMLIPYTRLKLMECVGQGMKAQSCIILGNLCTFQHFVSS